MIQWKVTPYKYPIDKFNVVVQIVISTCGEWRQEDWGLGSALTIEMIPQNSNNNKKNYIIAI